MRGRVIAAVILSASLWGTPAAFATFHPGEIIVSTVEGPVNEPNPLAFVGKIRRFGPDGTLIEELFSGDNIGADDLKFSPQGILHGAAGTIVLRFADNGSTLPPLQPASTGYFMHSLAFARSGRLFATSPDGAVLKFDSAGNPAGVSSLGTGVSSWADLGLDQCTLFFLTSPASRIGRFDTCSGTLSSPLQTTVNLDRTLLVLADGTLLASTNQSDMYRIGLDGAVLRHYSTHASAYARDTNPNFVWVMVLGKFAKFDLTGDVITAGPFDVGTGSITGIAIVGADVQSIPAFAPLLQLILSVALAISAVLRLRT
ncbi:MAG: hypothetical protein QOC81_993 [Thermoanaerobaculia bacterium]|jgi:hypothetical protein|nr:hypothetical protein [Thermoanaerobaculia bacterium]